MKIDQYCQLQRCKARRNGAILVCFCVARVCQQQLGFLVLENSEPKTEQEQNSDNSETNCYKLIILLNQPHFGLCVLNQSFESLLETYDYIVM